MAFFDVIHRAISECKDEIINSKSAFTSHVVSDSRKGPTNRTFVLDVKKCQIRLIVNPGQDNYIEKTLFLTPQPVVFPSLLSLSQCGSYLALATNTSAHIVDVVKLEPVIQSQQKKVVVKLFTAYDSLSGARNHLSQLIRLRWHPSINGLLVLLTEDGLLQFVRCEKSLGGNLLLELVLSVHVLQNRELAPISRENENTMTTRSPNSTTLNLSLALGGVCTDFDIGSPIFSVENSSKLSNPLRCPIYIICENGDIIMVSLSSASEVQALVRVIRILPSSEDYYTYDFDALLCIRAENNDDRPDVLCFANRVGRIFHGIILHVPPSVLLNPTNKRQGRSVPIIYLIDVANLQLSLLSGSGQESNAPTPEDELKLSKLSLISASECIQRGTSSNFFLCVHDFGIHYIYLPWLGLLKRLCSDDVRNNKLDILVHLRESTCIVEHLILTQHLRNTSDHNDNSGYHFRRPILGLILVNSSSDHFTAEDGNTFDRQSKLLVLFAAKPHAVEILLPNTHSRPSNCMLPNESPSEKTTNDLNSSSTTLLNSRQMESNFVRNCWKILSSDDTPRLPIISTSATDEESSESNFIRFFIKATNMLRTTRLNRLATLISSVHQFAEHVEEQLAAQYEEISFLANERNQMHNTSVALTDRHSQILERQETLNHRLSELTRRIYSIELGLTDSELAMRDEVQKLRDRLKSCLLGWFENIRLQYDHLVSRLDRVERYSVTDGGNLNLLGRCRTTNGSENLTQPEVFAVTEALKEEGSEIDSLIKAVEKLNSLSIT